ncbi:MAG TPA: NAD(P)H-dependent oxidoreductase [Bryobacteraceae bacterium]|nr:NAD(P)H-dependent oxidoreductase [Bryobacteraceae bacterium]
MLKLPMRLVLASLIAAAAAAAPVRILIAYHSQTGNTAKLAAAVRDGAAAVPGVEVLLRSVSDAGAEDIAKSDGIVVGTPVHWGNLSAEAKRFIDRIAEVLGMTGKTLGEGRTAGVFCTAGTVSNGQEMARLAAIAAFLDMRFIVVGGVNDAGYGSLGPQAVTGGSPPGISDRDRAEARRFGERFARLTLQFRAGAKP